MPAKVRMLSFQRASPVLMLESRAHSREAVEPCIIPVMLVQMDTLFVRRYSASMLWSNCGAKFHPLNWGSAPLIAAALLALYVGPVTAQNISPAMAKKHVGEKQTVCGKVSDSHPGRRDGEVVRYIDFDGQYPNETFAAWYRQEEEPKVGNVPKVGVLCVTGIIENMDAVASILLHSTADWSIPGLRFRKPPVPIKSEIRVAR